MSTALSLQLASKTGTDQFLTYSDGSTMLLDFFSAQSAPYGDWANEVVAQTWQTQGDLTVPGSTWYTEIQSGGDYLADMWLRIGVAALYNQCLISLGTDGAAGGTTAFRLVLPSGPAASGQASVLIAEGVLGRTAATVDASSTSTVEAVAFTATTNGASGWFAMDESAAPAYNITGLGNAFIPETHSAFRKVNDNCRVPTGLTGPIQLVESANQQDVAPYYCDYGACALIRDYQTKFGTNEYTTIYRENFVVYHEIYVPAHKRLDAALGHHANPQVLKARAMRNQTWYLQIPNFWCTSYLKAYPQGSCNLTKQKITIHTESVYAVIVNGCGTSSTFLQSSKGSYASNQIDMGADANLYHTISEDTSSATAANSLMGIDLTIAAVAPTARTNLIDPAHYSMDLLCEWIVLPEDERDAMLGVEDTLLIHQFGREAMAHVTSSVATSYDIQVLHPVAAFHVLGQRKSAQNQNKLCDYGGLGNPLTATNAEPNGVCRVPWIKSLGMTFNGKDRFAQQGPEMYLQVENAKHAEQVPDYEHGLEIYSMHFCLGNPFAPQASGSCNPARIEFKKITFTPHPSLFQINTFSNGLDHTTCIAGSADYVMPYVLDIHYNVGLVQRNMFGVVYS